MCRDSLVEILGVSAIVVFGTAITGAWGLVPAIAFKKDKVLAVSAFTEITRSAGLILSAVTWVGSMSGQCSVSFYLSADSRFILSESISNRGLS